MDAEMYNNFLRDITDIETFQDFVKDCYQNKGEPKKSGKRFNPLLVLSEEEFKIKYRFSKDNMRRIIELIKDDLDNTDTVVVRKSPQVPIDLQVMAALRLWGNSEHPLMTAYQHGVSSRTLARICKHVSAALSSKASFHIRMPAKLTEKETTTHAFQSLAGNGSKMANVIGAVEHHSVRFRRQAEPHKSATTPLDITANHLNDEQIHIQIISDAFCKIRDIDCKLRHANDRNDANETFISSRIKERFEQNEFRGRILLGAEGLACTSYLFTPFEFPRNFKEKSYNRAHSATIAPAEQSLTMFKHRFGILESEIASTFNTARNTIVAMAVLHNLAIDWGESTNLEHTESTMHNQTNCPTFKNLETNSRMEFIKNHF